MNELSPEAKELLAVASGADDPSGDDRARVRRALMAAVAATAVSGASAVAAGVSGVAGSTSAAAGASSLGAASGAASGGAASGGAASGGAASGGAASGGAASAGAASAGAASGGAASAGAASAGAASAGAASAIGGGGAVAGTGSAFGVKVLALLVTVGAGTAVVSQPWRDDTVEESVEVRAIDTFDAHAERRAEPSSSPRVVQDEPEAPVAPPIEAAPVVEPIGLEPEDAPRTATRRAESRERATEAPASADTLAAELALLRRARASLAAGELDRASDALAEHEASFATGVLRAEREGTRALVRCAERPQPEVARAFERLHPGSPLLARIQSACDDSP